LDSKI